MASHERRVAELAKIDAEINAAAAEVNAEVRGDLSDDKASVLQLALVHFQLDGIRRTLAVGVEALSRLASAVEHKS